MVAMTKDQILASIAVAAATLALVILTLTSDDGTPHPHPSISLSLRTGSRRLQTAVTPSLVIDPKTVTPRIPLSPDSSFVSQSPSPPSSSSLSDPIHILITVCNGHGARDGTAGRYQEVVDQLRTIQRYGMQQAHSQDEIVVHIFTDDPNTLQNDFIQQPTTAKLTSNLNIGVYPLPPPKSSTENYHKFHTCASARMYAPHLFTSVYGNDIPRRVIYLDTDTLVTAPLRNLWDMSRTLFAEHDDGHAALFGTAQECLSSPNEEGYAGGGEKTPYKFTNARNCEGYNSGVLIAHLHRWRNQYFSGMVLEQEIHASENGYGMKYGDQGILNAMSSRFPERHVTIPCWWNLRTDTMEKCLENYWKNGGGVIHGSRSVFHEDSKFSKPASVDLHDYLVRDNDMLSLEEVNDLRSKMERYDQNDVENEMFASILRQLIEREVHLLTE